MSPFRAVFFDFGGTLFSYTAFQRAMRGGEGKPLFVEAAERLGLDADRKTIGRAYGKASMRAFQKYSPRDYYLHRHLFEDTFRMFARELGTEADDAFVTWFYELQRDTHGKRLVPVAG